MKAVRWSNITLSQYQDAYKLVLSPAGNDADEVDRVSRLICIIFDLTEAQVEALDLVKFNRMAKRCQFILNEPVPGKPRKGVRIGCRWFSYAYDIEQLTYGQYLSIGVMFAENPVANMHTILASFARRSGPFTSRPITDAELKALKAHLLEMPVTSVFGTYAALLSQLKAYVSRYPGLFDITDGPDDNAEDPEEAKQHKADTFLTRFGWMINSKALADLENLSIEQVHEMSIVKALNDLSFLKAKASYEKREAASAKLKGNH